MVTFLAKNESKTCYHIFTNKHMNGFNMHSVAAQIQTTVLKPVKGILGNEILNIKAPQWRKTGNQVKVDTEANNASLKQIHQATHTLPEKRICNSATVSVQKWWLIRKRLSASILGQWANVEHVIKKLSGSLFPPAALLCGLRHLSHPVKPPSDVYGNPDLSLMLLLL